MAYVVAVEVESVVDIVVGRRREARHHACILQFEPGVEPSAYYLYVVHRILANAPHRPTSAFGDISEPKISHIIPLGKESRHLFSATGACCLQAGNSLHRAAKAPNHAASAAVRAEDAKHLKLGLLK